MTSNPLWTEHYLAATKHLLNARAASESQLWDIARLELAEAREQTTQMSLALPRAQETL